ncbi:hypothetical protein [Halomonas sp. IOP_31]|uniref:hypothetical protein n=1 Tax=Halomonas sp. IOP_31 TaxID=2876584 RepID=UPI001E551017|nr:hypothetical protein [Halomonas sp. IOP_31]MCD6007829.1 hypothetical protein [Halomonas sp. IOP_31]
MRLALSKLAASSNAARIFLRRDAGQVVAVEVQQVEGLIDQPARVAAAQRLLQTSETADAVGGEGDDLAVERRQLRIGLPGQGLTSRPAQLPYALGRSRGVLAIIAFGRTLPGALVACLRLPDVVDVLGDLVHGAVAGDAAIVVADLQRLIL